MMSPLLPEYQPSEGCAVHAGRRIKPLLAAMYADKVMPAPRIKGTDHKRRTAYYKSIGWLGASMLYRFAELRGASKTKLQYLEATASRLIKDERKMKDILKPGEAPLIREPFLFGFMMQVPPVKSGPRKGQLPANAGDYDNYLKAFVDAAKRAGVIAEDNLSQWRGCVSLETDRLPVSIGPSWLFCWGFYPLPVIEDSKFRLLDVSESPFAGLD